MLARFYVGEHFWQQAVQVAVVFACCIGIHGKKRLAQDLLLLVRRFKPHSAGCFLKQAITLLSPPPPFSPLLSGEIEFNSAQFSSGAMTKG